MEEKSGWTSCEKEGYMGVVSCFVWEKGVGVINYKNKKVDFDIGKQGVRDFRKNATTSLIQRGD